MSKFMIAVMAAIFLLSSFSNEAGFLNDKTPNKPPSGISAESTHSSSLDISTDIEPIYNAKSQQINIDYNEVFDIAALLDDSLVYLSIKDREAAYFRTYFTGETIKLGDIPGFVLNRGEVVLLESNLYLFVSTVDPKTNVISNDLVSIDLSKNTLTQFENHDGSVAGIPIYIFGENVLTLKNIVSGSNIATIVQTIDVNNNQWEDLITCQVDTGTNIGDAILTLCANDKNLCILYDICKGEETETYLKIFDQEMNELKSIKISEELHDFILKVYVSAMEIVDDYIYIYNASGYSFLGRVVGDELIEIYKGRFLIMAKSHSTADPIFYIIRGDKAYTLDKLNGKLIEHSIEISNGHAIAHLTANRNKVAIVFKNEEYEKFSFLVDRDKVYDMRYECKEFEQVQSK